MQNPSDPAGQFDLNPDSNKPDIDPGIELQDDLEGDTLREECGVFGIFGHPEAAAITALGLHALQHRGQEAAGIVSFDGSRFHSERRLGLVGDTFSRREVIERLPGIMAVGHVRYSTTGATILRNVQPLFAELNIFGHPEPRPSPRSACTPCSIAARKPPASSRYDGKQFHSERRLGLVGDNFSRRDVIERLPGNIAVGHVRYSTTGETILRNVQPLFAELNAGGFAVGHNGNLTNGLTLRRELVANGAMMQSTTDTEVILHLVARSPGATASSTASSRRCARSKAPTRWSA